MKRIVTVIALLAAAAGVTVSISSAVESAGKLSKTELKALIVSAKTPADHAKLAKYYRYEAAMLQAEVKDHDEMAADYDKNPMGHPIPKAQTLGDHCRNLVRYDNEAVKEANEMAAMHEEMAKSIK